MAARRQDAWEAQLEEKAFLVATIEPIVDDTATFKPPIPYALREVKRSMDKGIYFKDNTYGLAGIAGVPHATAMHEYDTTGLSGLKSLLGTSLNAMRAQQLCQESHVELLHLGAWHSG